MANVLSAPTALQRLGVGAELPGLIADLGANPGALFAEVGLDHAAVGPDLRLPFPSLLHLLHRAAVVTGCEHLGVLCGLRFELRHHGVIGDLMQSAPSLAQALEDFVTWQPGYSSGAIVYLHRAGPDHTLGYGIYTATAPGAEILYDTVVGVGVRLVQLLTRGAVGPVEVRLSRSAPPQGGAHARLLRVPVRFDQDCTGLILDRRAMATPLPSASAERRRAVLDLIARQSRRPDVSHADRVRREIRRALLAGPPRMPAISAALGFDARTLRRRLQAEGTSFNLLNDEVRLAVARELLDLTALPIGDIANATGFASASVFSESFRRWTGQSASSLRRDGQDLAQRHRPR